MDQYWVEGLYIAGNNLQKVRKSGQYSETDVEPFSKSFWANNPNEAIQAANDHLKGGEWVEGPRIVQRSEEQRMRAMGAPELPGF